MWMREGLAVGIDCSRAFAMSGEPGVVGGAFISGLGLQDLGHGVAAVRVVAGFRLGCSTMPGGVAGLGLWVKNRCWGESWGSGAEAAMRARILG